MSIGTDLATGDADREPRKRTRDGMMELETGIRGLFAMTSENSGNVQYSSCPYVAIAASRWELAGAVAVLLPGARPGPHDKLARLRFRISVLAY